jgi:hypothetical protein
MQIVDQIVAHVLPRGNYGTWNQPRIAEDNIGTSIGTSYANTLASAKTYLRKRKVYYNPILCNICCELIFEALRGVIPSEFLTGRHLRHSIYVSPFPNGRGGAILGIVSLEVEAKSFQLTIPKFAKFICEKSEGSRKGLFKNQDYAALCSNCEHTSTNCLQEQVHRLSILLTGTG